MTIIPRKIILYIKIFVICWASRVHPIYCDIFCPVERVQYMASDISKRRRSPLVHSWKAFIGNVAIWNCTFLRHFLPCCAETYLHSAHSPSSSSCFNFCGKQKRKKISPSVLYDLHYSVSKYICRGKLKRYQNLDCNPYMICDSFFLIQYIFSFDVYI